VELLRRLAGSPWLRALVSAGLLAVVALQIDFADAGEQLADARWGLFAAATATLLASFVVGGLRWWLFLRAAAVETSAESALRAYLIGSFVNTFLPSQVGGDVARAWIAGTRGTRMRAGATVVIDRATALGCLIAIACAGVLVDVRSVPWEVAVALGAAAAAFAATLPAALVLVGAGARFRHRLPDRVGRWGADAVAAARACLRPSVLRPTIAIGLAFQGLVALALWLMARSIDVDAPFAVIVAVVPPILIATAAPVSIGGLGVREGLYVLLLGYAGVDATDATLLSLLSGLAFVIASLPGAAALLVRGRGAAVSPADASPKSRAETT
jgi:uncharacterized membrane protein YbhN (UPF0104 family)